LILTFPDHRLLELQEIEMKEILVNFPGGARVDAHFDGFTVQTDQPIQAGGEDSAPSPFSLFLASLATCAGIYVLGFCRQRNLPTEGIQILQRMEKDPVSGMVTRVDLDIQVPASFPEKYRPSLVRSAELCAVKKHIENPPQFNITTSEANS
jgi:ribosomal protein S12 methylthiotransferase accessory factor